jgi:hypothetical protein
MDQLNLFKDAKIELVGHSHKEGAAKFINDFEQWKLEIDNPLPTSKETWDYQASHIQDLEVKVVAAANLIKQSRKTIEELRDFIGEQIELIAKLEKENEDLKSNV